MSKRNASKSTYTLEKANIAIDAIADRKTVAGAARAVGVSRKTLYNWKRANPAFADRWDDAQEGITDDIEATAIEKAIEDRDTALLIFLLKTRRRILYQESIAHTGEDGGPLKVVIERVSREAST